MIIKEIQKNLRERIYVSTDVYKSHEICSVRVFVEVEPGKWLPTPKGIAFSSRLLPEIIEGLKATQETLNQEG